jgi:hypothetical protein
MEGWAMPITNLSSLTFAKHATQHLQNQHPPQTGAFTKPDCAPDPKPALNTTKSIYTIQTMPSDLKGTTLELNNVNISWKSSNTWKVRQ